VKQSFTADRLIDGSGIEYVTHCSGISRANMNDEYGKLRHTVIPTDLETDQRSEADHW
jgi:hypothetical protein